ncbi:MAG: TetR/AcrR family transcriptional regulator [Oscillospiraceae bacterium]|nr:TetR/AcrR family transcriptional regulator [Oscillospiraceae bacterium]
MNNRIEKTKQSISNAFIDLRSKKSLEKITIKELCETAQINKSTFYVYYRDIYDLSDKIEDEIVSEVIRSLDTTGKILENSAELSKSLFYAYTAQTSLISVIFSGMRAQQLPKKIEAALREAIFSVYPEYKDDIDFNVRLTYSIYGGFYTYMKYRNSENKAVVDIIGKMSEKLMEQ